MRKLYLLLVLLITSIGLSAQWVQVGESLYGENSSEYFGHGVAMNGDGSIVAGSSIGYLLNTGKVGVFEFEDGDWVQLGNDIEGTESYQNYGFDLSINDIGNVLALSFEPGGNDKGKVRVYEYLNGEWEQVGQTLEGDSIGDRFGCSVDLNDAGNILAVGARTSDINGFSAGSARVYELNNDEWELLGDPFYGEDTGVNFGMDLGLNSEGDKLVVGVPYWEDPNGPNNVSNGKVMVYEYLDNEWEQLGNNILEGDFSSDNFGHHVDINDEGSRIIVSKFRSEENVFQGCVKVFELVDNNWEQIGQDVLGEVAENGYRSDIAISSDGNIISVGVKDDDEYESNAGKVSAYYFENEEWIQLGENIYGEANGDNFGAKVCMDNSGYIMCSGSIQNDFITSSAGQLRVFSHTELPVQVEEISKNDKIDVYPNPAAEWIIVRGTQIQNIYLLDSSGRTIRSWNHHSNNESKLDLSSINSGVYFLKFDIAMKSQTKKLIIH